MSVGSGKKRRGGDRPQKGINPEGTGRRLVFFTLHLPSDSFRGKINNDKDEIGHSYIQDIKTLSHINT